MDFYPAARYCRDGRMVIVPDQPASDALGPDWADTPARWYPENQTVHSVTVEVSQEPSVEVPLPVVEKRRPGRPRKGA